MGYGYAGWSENYIPQEIVKAALPEKYAELEEFLKKNEMDLNILSESMWMDGIQDENIVQEAEKLTDQFKAEFFAATGLNIELYYCGSDDINVPEDVQDSFCYWGILNAFTMNPDYTEFCSKYKIDEWTSFVTGG